MKEDSYSKGYRAREYDRFSDIEPQKLKKKTSFLTVLLIGLLLLLICSLCYDNVLKPYLEKREQQIESIVPSAPQENELTATDETGDVTCEDEYPTPEVIEEPNQRNNIVSSEQVEHNTITAKSSIDPKTRPTIETTNEHAIESATEHAVEPVSEPAIVSADKSAETSKMPENGEVQNNPTATQSSTENESELSTLEILERKNHAEVVKQAKRAGVSTEGSTLEIMERINRKELLKMGY